MASEREKAGMALGEERQDRVGMRTKDQPSRTKQVHTQERVEAISGAARSQSVN